MESFANMNSIDILILAIIFISLIIGFGRGLVSEVLSLVTLIAAFAIAIMFTSTLSATFTNSTAVQSVVAQTTTAVGTSTAQPVSYMALGVSFAILFIATIIAGGIVKSLLNIVFSGGILGFGNRLLGAVFGVVRGLLICLVVIFLVQLSPAAAQPWWQQSRYVPYFQPGVVALGNIVSPALANLKTTFGSAVKDVNDSVETLKKSITTTP